MKIYKMTLLILAAAVVLSLAGCAKNGASSGGSSNSTSSEPVLEEYPVEVNGIHLNAQPQRVVSLSPSLTEVIGDLGYAGALVGVSDYCDWPESVSSLARCGSFLLPDFETISQLKPDLVVSSAALAEADLTRLQQLGADVIVLENPRSLDELRSFYQKIGLMMGGKTTGGAAASSLTDEVFGRLDTLSGTIRSYLDAGGQKVSGAYLSALPYNTATGDTLEHALLEYLSVENAAGSYTNYIYPKEFVKEFNPDLVFYNFRNISEEEMAACDLIKNTRAERDQRIYSVDGVLVERRGLRMVELLESMAQDAYPDAF